jgi:hypothetical protein
MPASIAIQTASQSYVLGLLNKYLPLSGGALQGPLNLSSDPQSSLQAATKEYVDNSVQSMDSSLQSSLSAKVSSQPLGSQVVHQPGGTTLSVNSLNSTYLASQWQNGAGNNGIANAISDNCAGVGCHVLVDPGYSNTEVPNGYDQQTPSGFQGFTWPQETSVEDYRNGNIFYAVHDPWTPYGGGAPTASGLMLDTDFDYTQAAFLTGANNYMGGKVGLTLNTNDFFGTNNTQNTFGPNGGIPMVGGYGAFDQGLLSNINRWDSGQTFDFMGYTQCHGTGDCMWSWGKVIADGGINRRDDEGVKWQDAVVEEDPNVFTGTITGSPTTGATVLTTSCTYGCTSQGKDRILIDTNSSKTITGTITGNAGGIANTQVPPSVTASGASWPVSTMMTLCYPGSDNGAGGASGCPTNGTAPSGYIPPQASSPTQQAPLSPITVNVMDSYPGIPSTFCTNSNLQSTNSSGACYIPATGVGCLVDPQEYETVNYSYNQTNQQITLTNLTSSHLNGMVFAVGGLCGYALEMNSSIYTQAGQGGSGTESQVIPIAGSDNPTHAYLEVQRTNEGYGTVFPGGGSNGLSGTGSEYDGEVQFSTTGYWMSLLPDGKTVQIYINWQAGGSGPSLDGLPVTINSANSTYNGTYTLTYAGQSPYGGASYYTYQPNPAPSGTTPSTATVSYSNMQFTMYPEARVNSVYDTANNTVDGTFYLQPITVQWASGDPVREPHFQQMQVTGVGNPTYVARFTPEQYLGPADAGVTYNGLNTNETPAGFEITNTTSPNLYQMHGGTFAPPGLAYGAWGTYFSTIQANPPDHAIISINGFKGNMATNDLAQAYDLFYLPVNTAIEQQGGGWNDVALSYDPNYQWSNMAGTGQGPVGRFYFAPESMNTPANTSINGFSNVQVQSGYLYADRVMGAPALNAGGSVLSTNFVNAPSPSVSVAGTTGSTTYTYALVGHTIAGGVTTVSSTTQVTNGNATLSATNYNNVCVGYQSWAFPQIANWDILKVVGGTYYALGTNVAISPTNGNVCVEDTGQSLSAYNAPATNTSNMTEMNGPLTVNGALTASGITNSGGYTQTGSAANTFTAPVTINHSGPQGQITTQMQLINAAGLGGTGSAIDLFTYTGFNGLPGVRIAATDDAAYSGVFTIFNKQDGQAGDGPLEASVTVTGNGNVAPATPGNGNVQTGTITLSGSITVGGGSKVNAINYYSTASITPTAVSAQTCSDQTFTVTGLTTSDNLGSITPPAALGNVSVSGYVSAANTLDLHFCNPSAASVTPPAGVYGFLAMH